MPVHKPKGRVLDRAIETDAKTAEYIAYEFRNRPLGEKGERATSVRVHKRLVRADGEDFAVWIVIARAAVSPLQKADYRARKAAQAEKDEAWLAQHDENMRQLEDSRRADRESITLLPVSRKQDSTS